MDYEYRQDSNLYYLTGITQEDTALVLMPGNATRREVLFIKDRNPEREHWTGRLLSREEARQRTGIATVLSSSAFDAFIGGLLSRRSYGSTIDEKEAASFFERARRRTREAGGRNETAATRTIRRHASQAFLAQAARAVRRVRRRRRDADADRRFAWSRHHTSSRC